MNREVHDYDSRIRAVIKRIENGNFKGSNKNDFLEFYSFIVAEGLSKGRISKLLYNMLKVEEWLDKPFRECGKIDIVKLIQKIENMDYTPHTKHDYKVVIKKFFRWLRGTENYPEEVRWVKTTIKRNENKIPEELLNVKEIMRQINASDHPRDKALVSSLYESGCRPTEFLSLCIKHVVFDKNGAHVTIPRGKTGMRKIRLVASVPYLIAWIDIHPMRDNPDSLLWISIGTRNKNRPLRYTSLNSRLQKIAKKAGVKKRIYPYIFRHTRATHMANYLTEFQMCQYFGWVQGSKMPRIYVHLSSRDLDGPILKMYGLKEDKEKKAEILMPKFCPNCKTINSSTGMVCQKCGTYLDIKVEMKAEEKREKVERLVSYMSKDPIMRSIIIEKARQMSV